MTEKWESGKGRAAKDAAEDAFGATKAACAAWARPARWSGSAGQADGTSLILPSKRAMSSWLKVRSVPMP